MAKRPIKEGVLESSELPEQGNFEWVVAKTLLEANARTTEAFEYHLLRVCRDDGSADVESMLSNIQRAITEHERIIENLELAAEAVAELESKS